MGHWTNAQMIVRRDNSTRRLTAEIRAFFEERGTGHDVVEHPGEILFSYKGWHDTATDELIPHLKQTKALTSPKYATLILMGEDDDYPQVYMDLRYAELVSIRRQLEDARAALREEPIK